LHISSFFLSLVRAIIAYFREVDRAYIVTVSKARHDPDLIRELPAARVVGPAPGGWAEAVTDFLAWSDRPA